VPANISVCGSPPELHVTLDKVGEGVGDLVGGVGATVGFALTLLQTAERESIQGLSEHVDIASS